VTHMSPVAPFEDERYATVAGLVERSAAAQVSGIPEDPADDGFFGPASVAWRVIMDVSGFIGGMRSLLIQALHPLAMAGVDQHSRWRRDPIGRLAATTSYLATMTYGDRATAEQAAAGVRRIHEHVRGVDTVTGRPYDATDPALLLWVHGCLVDSTLVACELFGAGLAGPEQERYVAEMAVAAELAGIPSGLVPRSVAAVGKYFDSVRPELRCTPAATEFRDYLLSPPGVDENIADIWQDIVAGALASLPYWARDLYGYGHEPLTDGRRAEIRQVLGVLDAVYLGEPGVLEARQRLTLRMRAAQRA
jgi:uncharacterized protein (DUF2236 family)